MVKSKLGGRIYVVVSYLVALAVAMAIAMALPAMHPVWVALIGDLAATVVIFVASVLLDNSSVYDPYWSVAPPMVSVYWLAVSGPASIGLRQVALVILAFAWGIRLTANWARRWGGPADEDFRYREIRGKTGRLYWPASLVSIHLMPTLWVFLGMLPMFPALTAGDAFGIVDAIAFTVTVLAIGVEAVADKQLRKFLRSAHEPASILRTGLWGRCRHPNYLGEILFWWGLFLFGVAARPSWAWTVVGPLSITLLFVLVSIPWMDRRMLSRHPAWAEQMKNVPALLPWWSRRPD
jgi:steroid 5-alpha reductase family enzyme